jgi:hypothetical protein
VPAVGLLVLHKPDDGKLVSIMRFDTEEDLRKGDATLSSWTRPLQAALVVGCRSSSTRSASTSTSEQVSQRVAHPSADGRAASLDSDHGQCGRLPLNWVLADATSPERELCPSHAVTSRSSGLPDLILGVESTSSVAAPLNRKRPRGRRDPYGRRPVAGGGRRSVGGRTPDVASPIVSDWGSPVPGGRAGRVAASWWGRSRVEPDHSSL